MRKLNCLFVLTLAMVATSVQALDLKGVAVGKVATLAQIREAFGKDCKFDDHCYSEIEGVQVKVEISKGKDGRDDWVKAQFSSNQFEIIEKAALAKFGKPSESDQEVMQNGFGARYQAKMYWWNDAEGARVTLLKSFEDSTLTVTRAEIVKKDDARRTKSKM